eukprot:3366628-Alexandrium_andersonii.AAC.1
MAGHLGDCAGGVARAASARVSSDVCGCASAGAGSMPAAAAMLLSTTSTDPATRDLSSASP